MRGVEVSLSMPSFHDRRAKVCVRTLCVVLAAGTPTLALFGWLGWYQWSGNRWFHSNRAFLESVHWVIGVEPHQLRGSIRDHSLGKCSHAIPTGIPEARVLKILGEPTHVVTAEHAVEGGSYPWPGYAFKERAVTHHVLIYLSGDAIGYVWIDCRGDVEDVFTGPS